MFKMTHTEIIESESLDDLIERAVTGDRILLVDSLRVDGVIRRWKMRPDNRAVVEEDGVCLRLDDGTKLYEGGFEANYWIPRSDNRLVMQRDSTLILDDGTPAAELPDHICEWNIRPDNRVVFLYAGRLYLDDGSLASSLEEVGEGSWNIRPDNRIVVDTGEALVLDDGAVLYNEYAEDFAFRSDNRMVIETDEGLLLLDDGTPLAGDDHTAFNWSVLPDNRILLDDEGTIRVENIVLCNDEDIRSWEMTRDGHLAVEVGLQLFLIVIKPKQRVMATNL